MGQQMKRKESKLLENTNRSERDNPVPGMVQEFFVFGREGIKQVSLSLAFPNF